MNVMHMTIDKYRAIAKKERIVVNDEMKWKKANLYSA